VAADDIAKVLVEPVVEAWARLSTSGVSGYTKSSDVIVRGMRGKEGGCEPIDNASR
jgi:hypothetical protein